MLLQGVEDGINMVLGTNSMGRAASTLYFDSPITPLYFIPGLVAEKYMADLDFSAR